MTQALNYYGLAHLTFYTALEILKPIRMSRGEPRAAQKAEKTQKATSDEEEATSFRMIELWLTKW